MTLISTEAPLTTATVPAFTVAYQGLAGQKVAPLEKTPDATQVEVTARIISSRRSGRTIWLGLQTGNGATAVASLHDRVGDSIPAADYDVDQVVRLSGTARTWPRHPYIAVRRFLPVV